MVQNLGHNGLSSHHAASPVSCRELAATRAAELIPGGDFEDQLWWAIFLAGAAPETPGRHLENASMTLESRLGASRLASAALATG